MGADFEVHTVDEIRGHGVADGLTPRATRAAEPGERRTPVPLQSYPRESLPKVGQRPRDYITSGPEAGVGPRVNSFSSGPEAGVGPGVNSPKAKGFRAKWKDRGCQAMEDSGCQATVETRDGLRCLNRIALDHEADPRRDLKGRRSYATGAPIWIGSGSISTHRVPV